MSTLDTKSAATPDAAAAEAQSARVALMSAKLGGSTDLKKKIDAELYKIAAVCVALLALGVYAFDFVVHGVMAKPDLNGLIILTFILTIYICARNVWILKDDNLAIASLQADFGEKRPDASVIDKPARVFKRPKLLGYGYSLVTEELLSRKHTQLSTETVHLLVKDVDDRIRDAKATMGYFGGLLVFLGLLGAFIGLMKTVASVGDLIGGMSMSGGGGTDQFGKMIEGMKKPLNGMSTGFSSSLFGLLFSMCVGLIDRFMAAAMKAVRNEFEACLMNLAQLELAHPTADSHGAKASHAPAAIVMQSGEPAITTAQFQQLVASLHRSEHHYAKSNEHLASLNASLYALATSMREATRSDGRREIAASIKELSQSQRQMALHFQALRGDLSDHQGRMVQAIETFTRAQEETRDAVSDIAMRGVTMVSGSQVPQKVIITGNGSAGGAGAAAGSAAAAGVGGAVHAGVGGTAAGRGGAAFNGGMQGHGMQGQGMQGAGVGIGETDAILTGARALMAKLSSALGQRRDGMMFGGKGVNEERARKLEQAVIATQQLSRQVLRRLDEARKDETRVAVAAGKAQRQLVASLDQLVSRMDDLMEEGEIVAKGRIDDLSIAIDEVRAQMDVSIDRLESHISAGRQDTARVQQVAQVAVTETAKLSRLIDERQAKAAGAR
jgi:hypothetical protein